MGKARTGKECRTDFQSVSPSGDGPEVHPTRQPLEGSSFRPSPIALDQPADPEQAQSDDAELQQLADIDDLGQLQHDRCGGEEQAEMLQNSTEGAHRERPLSKRARTAGHLSANPCVSGRGWPSGVL